MLRLKPLRSSCVGGLPTLSSSSVILSMICSRLLEAACVTHALAAAYIGRMPEAVVSGQFIGFRTTG
jgi:hypothetical protein